jgi:hypothetical protein
MNRIENLTFDEIEIGATARLSRTLSYKLMLRSPPSDRLAG